jgi:hypothetical protein
MAYILCGGLMKGRDIAARRRSFKPIIQATEVAAEVGVHPNWLTEIENERAGVTPEDARRLDDAITRIAARRGAKEVSTV